MNTTLPRARRTLVTLLVCVALLAGFVAGARPASATTAPTAAATLTIRDSVVNLLNAERRLLGRAPLRLNTYLVRSAHAHNLMMARYNTMSHLLPGEASLGSRISSCGYNPWHAVGENVAWNSDWSLAGALYLEKLMFNEVAPNNGHRLNILNTTYTDLGIDVYMDAAHHKLWITEDFGRH